jgi:putative YhdH/YhfP family quinone oxidoreductase
MSDTTFRAFVSEPAEDRDRRQIRELTTADLPAGELLVRVAYSSVNYKDALAARHDGRVAQANPLVPGIDLAGEVVESGDDAFPAGTPLIAHGYGLGVSHHGGFAEYARVPAAWALPVPDGLGTRDAMVIGTAGFAAAHCVHTLQERGLQADDGPVLVTGAAGGVGSSAVAMLAGLGFHVVASTGRAETERDFLTGLGAEEVIDRAETSAESRRPMEKERWAGAVDAVGGATLSYVLRTLRYGGAVAATGLAGGTKLDTTVLPFILRGVALLGVDTVQTEMGRRREVWQRLATDLRPRDLDAMATEITLDELEPVLDAILRGEVRGRTVVAL